MKKLLVAMLVAALMLGWGFGARQAQAGVVAPPTVDFSIGVVADGCKTGTGDTTCLVVAGDTFTVSVSIDSYSTATGAYSSLQARLDESAGLTYQNRAGLGEIVGVWPNCGICAETEGLLPGTYKVGGTLGFGAPGSTATGVVIEVDYKCPAAGSETVTKVHGFVPSATFLADEPGDPALDPDPDEVLTINCVAGVGGIVQLLAGGDSPAEGSASSSSDYTMAIAAAAAGAVLALAAGGWYARRRWLS